MDNHQACACTTWYIPEEFSPETPAGLVAFPQNCKAADHVAFSLLSLAKCAFTNHGKDFIIHSRQDQQIIFWRGHRALTAKGITYVLRQIHNIVPSLSAPSLTMPEFMPKIAKHEAFLKGGLMIVCGSAGQGKTTTATALLIDRLAAFGGVAITVEDPPEFQITGRQGKNGGFCMQLPVTEEQTFAEAIKSSLRCYPANTTNSLLFIGEVRDADVAAELFNAAINGLLVIATVHSQNIVTALQRLTSLAGDRLGLEETYRLAAQSFRAAFHQRLEYGIPRLRILLSDGNQPQIESRIRKGEMHTLEGEITRQNAMISRGEMLF
jgi:twitching motility protein PilT